MAEIASSRMITVAGFRPFSCHECRVMAVMQRCAHGDGWLFGYRESKGPIIGNMRCCYGNPDWYDQWIITYGPIAMFIYTEYEW